MKRSRPNPRNPRTTAIKKLVSERHDAVIERDANMEYNGVVVGQHCLFFFTPIGCWNRPQQVHELFARGKSRREAQRKWFVDENQAQICLECESIAQTTDGRKMLQDALGMIYHYSYDSAGYWPHYYEMNEKGVL